MAREVKPLDWHVRWDDGYEDLETEAEATELVAELLPDYDWVEVTRTHRYISIRTPLYD
jgi:hypothetical protein